MKLIKIILKNILFGWRGDDDVMYKGGNLDGKSIAYKGFFLMRKRIDNHWVLGYRNLDRFRESIHSIY